MYSMYGTNITDINYIIVVSIVMYLYPIQLYIVSCIQCNFIHKSTKLENFVRTLKLTLFYQVGISYTAGVVMEYIDKNIPTSYNLDSSVFILYSV